MRGNDTGTPGETRTSALWGTGNRGGESRSNALWGKGGRGRLLGTLALLALAAPLAAVAGSGSGSGELAPAYVAPALLVQAEQTPNVLVRVILQSSYGRSAAVQAFVDADRVDGEFDGEVVKRRLDLVHAVAVQLKAKKLRLLARTPGLTVTPDARMRLSGTPTTRQVWPTASGVKQLWPTATTPAPKPPTIAVVDSGIDDNRADFDLGARVVAKKVITQLQPNSPGDGRGHGTFVAGIAAGSAPDNSGAAPNADIVSIDVMDDHGMARTSDVIAAAEWILENKGPYNIRVANFSLHSTTPSNFTRDPLDRAVEKLWFAGIVVVVASGNYGNADGTASGVNYAPGNDPFVITVGAVDLDGSVATPRHDVPNWSAYGYTYDGFKKPELAAAGRYMIGPVPLVSTLKTDKPENVVAPTYMRLSGTSFAAPIVAGAAAQLLARHPGWTPNQVKGALMVTARWVPEAPAGSAGVGEVNALRASMVTSPPNPNLALSRFVKPDPAGGSSPVFDAASWESTAKANVSWDSVSWSDASWNSASWSSVSWSDVSWTDVSWTDVSWSDNAALADVSYEDAAGLEVASPDGDYVMNALVEAEAAADPELSLAGEPAAPTLP